MKKTSIAVGIALVIGTITLWGGVSKGSESGEALFVKNCAVCHDKGGNVINPRKTLHKSDREANNVKTADDIVTIMRKPGPGMTPFDKNTISEKQAREIANYILKTF